MPKKAALKQKPRIILAMQLALAQIIWVRSMLLPPRPWRTGNFQYSLAAKVHIQAAAALISVLAALC